MKEGRLPDGKDDEGSSGKAVLSAIHDKTRLSVLEELVQSDIPLPFALLQRRVGDPTTSSNFSYHLNKLVRAGLVEQVPEGYKLTSLGTEVTRKYLEVVRLARSRGRRILVRTSRYAFEPFDPSKLSEHLALEAGMDPPVARRVAGIAHERLKRAGVKYLTTPLLREYVNAVLVDEGLEDYRHRLTRLGLPGHDVDLLFRKFGGAKARRVPRAAGDAVLEQHVLLRVLPPQTADACLAGGLGIPRLARWLWTPDSVAWKASGEGEPVEAVSRLLGSEPARATIDLSDLATPRATRRLVPHLIDQFSGLLPGKTQSFVVLPWEDPGAKGEARNWERGAASRPVGYTPVLRLQPGGLEGVTDSIRRGQRLHLELELETTWRGKREARQGSKDHYALDLVNLFAKGNSTEEGLWAMLEEATEHLALAAGIKEKWLREHFTRNSSPAPGVALDSYLEEFPTLVSLVGLPELSALVNGFRPDETLRALTWTAATCRKIGKLLARLELAGPVELVGEATLLPPKFLATCARRDAASFGQTSRGGPLESVLASSGPPERDPFDCGYQRTLFRANEARKVSSYERMWKAMKGSLDSAPLAQLKWSEDAPAVVRALGRLGVHEFVVSQK
ncbi:MAG: hypothetical protein Kow0069_08630 [Promethearchaeota archaeon]